MRVLYIATIPSPYRVSFFNELGKRLELTVLFEKAESDERDSSWKNYRFENFDGIVMSGMKMSVNTAFCPSVVKFLTDKWDAIICCDLYTPTGFTAISYMKARRIPYWIEGDGAFPGKRQKLKGMVKKYLMHSAEGCFSTGSAHDQYYLQYGVPSQKIVRYPFSSLKTEEMLKLNGANDAERIEARKRIRRAAREKLKLDDRIMFLAVGQFIPRKGFDILLQAIREIPQTGSFFIVGAEPAQEYLRLKEEGHLDNVFFEGFKKPDELACYYNAADVFVLPTREDIWGLVINEAMAHALPVITTDKCSAGLEMVNRSNGLLVHAGNSKELADAVEKMLNSRDRDKMGMRALEKAYEYSVEAMAERHYKVIEKRRRLK